MARRFSRREKLAAILRISAMLSVPMVILTALAAVLVGLTAGQAILLGAAIYAVLILPLAWVAVGVAAIIDAAAAEELEDLERAAGRR